MFCITVLNMCKIEYELLIRHQCNTFVFLVRGDTFGRMGGIFTASVRMSTFIRILATTTDSLVLAIRRAIGLLLDSYM